MGDFRFASECVEDCGCLNDYSGSLVLEDDSSRFPVSLDAKDFGSGENLHSSLAEDVFHHLGYVIVRASEQLWTALYDDDTRSERVEIMGRFKGNGSASKNDDRWRNSVESSNSSLVMHPASARPGMLGMLITEPVAMRKDLALTVSRVPSRLLTSTVFLY